MTNDEEEQQDEEAGRFHVFLHQIGNGFELFGFGVVNVDLVNSFQKHIHHVQICTNTQYEKHSEISETSSFGPSQTPPLPASPHHPLSALWVPWAPVCWQVEAVVPGSVHESTGRTGKNLNPAARKKKSKPWGPINRRVSSRAISGNFNLGCAGMRMILSGFLVIECVYRWWSIPLGHFQEFTNNFPEVFHKPFHDNAKHEQLQADRTELGGCHHMSSDLLLPRWRWSPQSTWPGLHPQPDGHVLWCWGAIYEWLPAHL